jgi:hypothetical protein
LGLPVLKVPGGLPRFVDDRITLLMMRGLMGRRRSIEMAGRLLTELSCRSGRSRVAERLRRLVSDGYLTVVSASTYSMGVVYGKGWRLIRSSSFGRDVQVLADQLFGKWGFARSLIGVPAFGFGFINLSGLLVVGVLSRCDEPVEVAAVKCYLDGLLTSASVDRAISRLRDEGIVSSGRFVALVGGWRERLEGVASGKAVVRARTTKERHRIERDRHRLGLGRPTKSDEDRLLSFPCVVCGCEHDGTFQIEHFPPQVFLKRELGLSRKRSVMRAHWAFVNPICGICHDEFRRVMPKILELPVPLVRVSDLVLRSLSGEARRRALKAALLRRADQYYVAMRNGHFDRAVLWIGQGCAIWSAWTEEDSGLAAVGGVVEKPARRVIPGVRAAHPLPSRRLRRRSRLR